jgi:adenosylhomocysteine nucleosidase
MLTTLFASIGIMSAMPQEAAMIVDKMEEKEIVQMGSRQFIKGTLGKIPVVFSLAGIGKVSSAATAALLIAKFDVEEIIFTGVGGGGKETAIGDIVIGSSYLQHDLDPRPFFTQFYIFSLDKQLVHARADHVSKVKDAAHRFLQQKVPFPENLRISNPRVHEGAIVSGDQFIGSLAHHEKILDITKELLPSGFHAVDMEGAAVAQVCEELNVPFIVIRSISDKANHESVVDFTTFIDQVASQYSFGVLLEYFKDR